MTIVCCSSQSENVEHRMFGYKVLLLVLLLQLEVNGQQGKFPTN